MSNFRAVATVTATLQNVLQSAVQADVPGATVTVVRPGEDNSANLPTTGLNLYLYQVTQLPHRLNDDLPTRAADGTAVQRPVAPVELYYLMSCYGDDRSLEPQRVLGSAFAFLHAQPLLTRAQIQAAIADPSRTFLAAADLADAADLVRLTSINLTLDELSRLWTVFLQTHYVLSIVFKASPVLLERALTPRPALPTRGVQLVALPLHTPRIDAVLADAGAGAPILAGGAIALVGAALQGDATSVEIDGAAVAPTSVAEDRIVLALPPGLGAGPHAVQVRQGVAVGTSGPRPAFASGLAGFVVQPAITRTGGNPDIAVTNVQGSGANPRSATVTIGVAPVVGIAQTATLEVLSGQTVVQRALAAPLAAPAGQLVFALTGMAAGSYLLRVRVDGAASPLDLDAGGVPVGPQATIP